MKYDISYYERVTSYENSTTLVHSNSIFKSLVTYDARLIFCGWSLLFCPLACLDYVTRFKAA